MPAISNNKIIQAPPVDVTNSAEEVMGDPASVVIVGIGLDRAWALGWVCTFFADLDWDHVLIQEFRFLCTER